MSDTKTNVQILLDGHEIEPDGKYDFSFRKVPNLKASLYRGLPGQLTVNPDDKYRLQAWYGDKLGHNEQAVLQSDLNEVKYLAAFKNISTDCLNKTLNNSFFTINPTEYGVVILHIMNAVTIAINSPLHIGTKLKLIVEVAISGSHLIFHEDAIIHWSGEKPSFPTNVGDIFSINLTWTGDYWIGEYSPNVVPIFTPTKSEVSACLNASVMSLGYCLPAGSSDVGDFANKYALFTGVANYSDDDLINIANVSSNIGLINTVVTKLPKIEDLLIRYEKLNAKDIAASGE